MALTQVVNAGIVDDTVKESKLDIHADPSGTDKYLKYTSNGMEWATVSSGNAEKIELNNTKLQVEAVDNTVERISGYFDGDTTAVFNVNADGITLGKTGTSGNLNLNGAIQFGAHESGTSPYIRMAGSPSYLEITGAYNSGNSIGTVWTFGGYQGTHVSAGNINPSADSTYSLGLTGTRWTNVYADNLYGTLNGSDLTDDTVTEAKLDIHQAPADGKYLKYTSSNGMEWADVSAGTALTGSTDNTICTVTGANAIQGEANLTFNGSQLDLDTGSGTFNRWKTDQLRFNSTGTAHIDHYTTGQDFKFRVSGSSAADTTAFEIKSNGNIKTNGNLIIGTAGKGIDFSVNAGSSATGASTSSELLDHYEEGTWTPVFESTSTDPTYSNWHTTGTYIRIGGMCYIWFDPHEITFSGTAAAGYGYISGFPFASTDNGSLACGRTENVLKWAGTGNLRDAGLTMSSSNAQAEFNTAAPSRGFTWDVGNASSKGYFDIGGGYKCV